VNLFLQPKMALEFMDFHNQVREAG
jgi:hypothetical protein